MQDRLDDWEVGSERKRFEKVEVLEQSQRIRKLERVEKIKLTKSEDCMRTWRIDSVQRKRAKISNW
jgi:ribosome-binding protein aMBF1 (putative translation factor)